VRTSSTHGGATVKVPSQEKIVKGSGFVALVALGVIAAGLTIGWLSRGGAGKTAQDVATKAAAGLKGA